MALALLLAAALVAGNGPSAGAPAPPAGGDAKARRVASSRAIAHYLAARLLEQRGAREGVVTELRLAVAHDPQPEVASCGAQLP